MQDKNNKIGVWMLACFLMTMASIIFSILCLSNSYLPFVQRNYSWLICVVIVLLCLYCAIFIGAILRKKDMLIKTLLSIDVFLLFCLVLIFIFQKTGFFKLVNSSTGLQEYLEKTGVWMPILYITLQFLQVIVLPIPTVVSTVAGLALFGSFWTTIYSCIGIILGSVTAFFIGRKFGNKAVTWILGEETLKKWQKKLKGKDNLILTIMFLLPLFPDDVLCFIAGLSSMSNRFFIGMVTITRVIGIAGTCYSFDFIPFNTWWGCTIWMAVFISIITAFCYVYKNMDKIQKLYKRFKTKKNKKS